MTATVGIIVNPRAGHDIRRLVGHAGAPTHVGRLATLHRIVEGARSVGVERILIAADGFGLAQRAAETIDAARASDAVPEVRIEIVGGEPVGDGDDTARAAEAMRTAGADVVVASGGDGTYRDLARGWRTAPLVALAGGTNNAFAQAVDPTVGGTAAGLVATRDQPLDEYIAYEALVIDIEIDDIRTDLALVCAAVVPGPAPRSGSLWTIEGVEQILAAVAEPWSLGPSALVGMVAPTSRTGDRGVLVELDSTSDRRITGSIAPGRSVEAGLHAVSVVEVDQPVAIGGPAALAFDGEFVDRLGADDWATMTLRRNGPRVVDIRRTLSIGVRSGRFHHRVTSP